MKEPANTLRIREYRYRDSSIFGIKGIGEDYNTLFNILSSKYTGKYDSFGGFDSWHHIHFLNVKDENTFRNEPFVPPFVEHVEDCR